MKPTMYRITQSSLGKFTPPAAPTHQMTYTEASNWISRQSPGYQMLFNIVPVYS